MKNQMDKIEEFVFDKTLTKRPCIYARTGNVLHPILYFQKAKGASEEEFERVLRILIPKTNKKQ